MTISEQDSDGRVWTVISKSNVRKAITVEVRDHGHAHDRNVTLRNGNRRGEPSLAIAEENL